jgi:HEAT repeat protein
MPLRDKIETWLRGEEFDHLDDLVALGAEAVPDLIELARQAPDGMTRARAMEVLGRLRDRRAVQTLTGALQAGSSLERLTAARALAAVAGAEAVGALTGLLGDPDPSLVKVAVRSLAQVGDAAALAALERASGEPALAPLRGETLAAIQGIRSRIG